MTEIQADDYFAIVPEWLLYADVSANAVRLYAILNRYANSRGHAWPSRKTLADAMRCSIATVDRAREELTGAGAVTVIPRRNKAGDPTSNLYLLHSRPQLGVSPVTQGTPTNGGTRTPTSDGQTRANMNHSQKLGVTAPATSWCPTCHGRRVIMAPAEWDDTAGWTASNAPTPCPDCSTL